MLRERKKAETEKMSRRREDDIKGADDAEGVMHLGFDYGVLTPSLARFLKVQADRIRHQCVTSIVQIGRALLEAKRHLSHGAFLGWVQGEVHMPVRTAQAYMRVAGWAAGKSATVAHLSPTVLHLLSAPSTPPELIVEVLTRAEAGEFMAPSVVRRQLKVLRQQKSRSPDCQFESPVMRAHAQFDCVADEGTGCPSLLHKVVDILRAELASSEFDRLREIFTSDAMLGQPDIARELRLAFSTRAATSRAAQAVDQSVDMPMQE